MRLKVRLGNPTRDRNAYSVSQHGECYLLEIGAFREPSQLGCLFYKSLVELLREDVSSLWVQVQSRNSLGGGRKRDLNLVPKPPLLTTENFLAFDVLEAKDLDAAFNSFWPRRSVRFYGWEDLPFSDRLSNIETFSRQDKLQDICALAQKRLKFCAEKAIWGDFLRVLVSQTDLAWVNTSMRQVSGLLSEPLTMDESLFG
jgi:hypothetical protein